MSGDGDAQADRQKFSRIIHDETIRLTRLLDDLLDLSVLESGQVKLNSATTNIGEVLTRAVAATISHKKTRGIRIVRNASAEDIQVSTDADRLGQVFINVISNARKYCDTNHPELEIRVRQRGPMVQIDFVDNGNGIAKESQELIFEKLSRLEDQATEASAGLGLAICREIMQILGGDISYLPGQGGAAFRVAVPENNIRNRAAE